MNSPQRSPSVVWVTGRCGSCVFPPLFATPASTPTLTVHHSTFPPTFSVLSVTPTSPSRSFHYPASPLVSISQSPQLTTCLLASYLTTPPPHSVTSFLSSPFLPTHPHATLFQLSKKYLFLLLTHPSHSFPTNSSTSFPPLPQHSHASSPSRLYAARPDQEFHVASNTLLAMRVFSFWISQCLH